MLSVEFEIEESKIDFLDISLWDVYKLPEEKEHQNQSLLGQETNHYLPDKTQFFIHCTTQSES